MAWHKIHSYCDCFFVLDRGTFCRTTGTLCFRLRMTLLPMSFKPGWVHHHLHSFVASMEWPQSHLLSLGLRIEPGSPFVRRAHYHCPSLTPLKVHSYCNCLFSNISIFIFLRKKDSTQVPVEIQGHTHVCTLHVNVSYSLSVIQRPWISRNSGEFIRMNH